MNTYPEKDPNLVPVEALRPHVDDTVHGRFLARVLDMAEENLLHHVAEVEQVPVVERDKYDEFVH